MAFRVVVPSARYEDVTTNDLDQAWRICMDLSIEFGYAEIKQLSYNSLTYAFADEREDLLAELDARFAAFEATWSQSNP